MTSCPRVLAVLLAVVASAPIPAAEPIDGAELEALRARVRELEAQLREIAQRLDEQPVVTRASAPASRPAPLAANEPVAPAKTTVTDRGFALSSSDEANAIRLHGLVQLDARAFFNDGDAATDTFMLRRARLNGDGILARRFGFQFVTEFGGNDFSVRDASLTAQWADWAQLKAGKFKVPIGLELLQQGAVRPMIERSLVTNFVSIRDVGLQLSGEVLGGAVSYAAGVFNGMPDGAISANVDSDEPKDVAARLMWHPLRAAAGGPRLSLGVGGSRGRQRITAGHLPLYRSDGQQVFFAYRPAVQGEGEITRVSPQFDYRMGPLGVMAEWIQSTAGLHAAPNTPPARLAHRAWQLTSTYVLTGEDSSYYGLVPRADFSPGAGAWGAFEVVARYAAVTMDADAFPVFAAPETNANEMGAMGVGLNWHLSKAVRFMFNYTRTTFDVPAVQPAASMLRKGESVFASRLQLAF